MHVNQDASVGSRIPCEIRQVNPFSSRCNFIRASINDSTQKNSTEC